MLNYFYGSEDIYETRVISGLAYGQHTLLKVFLKIGVNVTDFITHIKQLIKQDQSQHLTDDSEVEVEVINIDESECEQ